MKLLLVAVSLMVVQTLAQVNDRLLTPTEFEEQKMRLGKLMEKAMTKARNLLEYHKVLDPNAYCLDEASISLKQSTVKAIRSTIGPLMQELIQYNPVDRTSFKLRVEGAAQELQLIMFLIGLKWSLDVEHSCTSKFRAQMEQ